MGRLRPQLRPEPSLHAPQPATKPATRCTPAFSTSAFLGVVAGLPGALLAWASLFGPGLLLILAALPFWQEIQAT